MAVALEFINFLIPISTIEEKYPGGFDQCLHDHRDLLGGRVWFDDYLFRDGAMSPAAMKGIVDHWESKGFSGIVRVDGQDRWSEFCVAEGLFGVTLPCEWVELMDHTAYLKGTDPGEVVRSER